ncbi:MAG: hypothetical protein EON54_12670, partial [Alcaligenaceae bacterium]
LVNHPADTFDVRDVLFKRYASCYLTHSLVAGLLSLRDELGSSSITEIRLHVTPVHQTTCGIDHPLTGLEGKFSMRFLAALTLIAGRVSDAEFSPQWMTDTRVRHLSARVRIIEDHTGPIMATPVDVHREDGPILRACIDVGKAASGDQLTEQHGRLAGKYNSLVIPILGRTNAEMLAGLAQRFDQLSHVEELMDSTRTSPS